MDTYPSCFVEDVYVCVTVTSIGLYFLKNIFFGPSPVLVIGYHPAGFELHCKVGESEIVLRLLRPQLHTLRVLAVIHVYTLT